MQTPIVAKTDPDILRVTVYVLNMSKAKQTFSVLSAAQSAALNGINEYRIAEILGDICLQPDGPNSIGRLTTIDQNYSHNIPGNWTLNAQAYFSYLSYLSVKNAEKANQTAKYSMWIAIAAFAISGISSLATLFN
ncbi:MAG: hypothetical protein OFPII_28520 [Osedax symbiont Rs1]|nr:MAG: hypothetical protein OFPII_28520 [Osedax symbiont Rs1]